jgi:hypothetical protein
MRAPCAPRSTIVTSAEAWNARRYLHRFRGYGRPHLALLAAGVGLRIGELLRAGAKCR